MTTTLTRRSDARLDEILIDRGGVREGRMTIAADPADPLAMFPAMLQAVRARGGEVCSQFVLGGTRHRPATWNAMGGVDWPITWLQGDACSGAHLRATQAFVVYGAAAEPVTLDGRVVGKVFRTPDATVCHLGDLLPGDLTASREVQARQLFEKMRAALESAGLALGDLVRTWLYLDRLLEWYDAFNAVRTQFFRETGIMEGLVPASTGIGAGNPAGAALVAAALAIRPHSGAVAAQAVASPLQCPALDYRSSFSRAAEVRWPECRELMISGTASIAPDGRSVHVGDTASQIARTMEVVEAILSSRGMSWSDTTRAIAYFTDMRDAHLLADFRRQCGLPPMPLALSHATVCRDDLMFEIELDAVRVD